jgi:hypothetical protein
MVRHMGSDDAWLYEHVHNHVAVYKRQLIHMARHVVGHMVEHTVRDMVEHMVEHTVRHMVHKRFGSSLSTNGSASTHSSIILWSCWMSAIAQRMKYRRRQWRALCTNGSQRCSSLASSIFSREVGSTWWWW